jgi:hypothetical protein
MSKEALNAAIEAEKRRETEIGKISDMTKEKEAFMGAVGIPETGLFDSLFKFSESQYSSENILAGVHLENAVNFAETSKDNADIIQKFQNIQDIYVKNDSDLQANLKSNNQSEYIEKLNKFESDQTQENKKELIEAGKKCLGELQHLFSSDVNRRFLSNLQDQKSNTYSQKDHLLYLEMKIKTNNYISKDISNWERIKLNEVTKSAESTLEEVAKSIKESLSNMSFFDSLFKKRQVQAKIKEITELLDPEQGSVSERLARLQSKFPDQAQTAQGVIDKISKQKEEINVQKIELETALETREAVKKAAAKKAATERAEKKAAIAEKAAAEKAAAEEVKSSFKKVMENIAGAPEKVAKNNEAINKKVEKAREGSKEAATTRAKEAATKARNNLLNDIKNPIKERGENIDFEAGRENSKKIAKDAVESIYEAVEESQEEKEAREEHIQSTRKILDSSIKEYMTNLESFGDPDLNNKIASSNINNVAFEKYKGRSNSIKKDIFRAGKYNLSIDDKLVFERENLKEYNASQEECFQKFKNTLVESSVSPKVINVIMNIGMQGGMAYSDGLLPATSANIFQNHPILGSIEVSKGAEYDVNIENGKLIVSYTANLTGVDKNGNVNSDLLKITKSTTASFNISDIDNNRFDPKVSVEINHVQCSHKCLDAVKDLARSFSSNERAEELIRIAGKEAGMVKDKEDLAINYLSQIGVKDISDNPIDQLNKIIDDIVEKKDKIDKSLHGKDGIVVDGYDDMSAEMIELGELIEDDTLLDVLSKDPTKIEAVKGLRGKIMSVDIEKLQKEAVTTRKLQDSLSRNIAAERDMINIPNIEGFLRGQDDITATEKSLTDKSKDLDLLKNKDKSRNVIMRFFRPNKELTNANKELESLSKKLENLTKKQNNFKSKLPAEIQDLINESSSVLKTDDILTIFNKKDKEDRDFMKEKRSVDSGKHDNFLARSTALQDIAIKERDEAAKAAAEAAAEKEVGHENLAKEASLSVGKLGKENVKEIISGLVSKQYELSDLEKGYAKKDLDIFQKLALEASKDSNNLSDLDNILENAYSKAAEVEKVKRTEVATKKQEETIRPTNSAENKEKIEKAQNDSGLTVEEYLKKAIELRGVIAQEAERDSLDTTFSDRKYNLRKELGILKVEKNNDLEKEVLKEKNRDLQNLLEKSPISEFINLLEDFKKEKIEAGKDSSEVNESQNKGVSERAEEDAKQNLEVINKISQSHPEVMTPELRDIQVQMNNLEDDQSLVNKNEELVELAGEVVVGVEDGRKTLADKIKEERSDQQNSEKSWVERTSSGNDGPSTGRVI